LVSGRPHERCFNEVDVHVLAGRGAQIRVSLRGGPLGSRRRRRPAAGPSSGKAITRQELLWQVAKHAVLLADLGLTKGDRIALNMPT